ncbi:MAG: DUF2163 domain-containing protein [bacterium]|nr:DUF2163 domain-containing protein [bacterium]
MSLVIPTNLAGLAAQQAHRFASLWLLDRVDSTQFRFTTHDQPLDFDDGSGTQEYKVGGAFNQSARRQQTGLKDRNLDIQGMITSADITTADLRAQLFHGATLTEFLVDWRYPWAGFFAKEVYQLESIEHDDEVWMADLAGVTSILGHKDGRVFGRTCNTSLFGARCGLLKSAETWYEVTGVRVEAASQSATEPQRVFGAVLSDIPSSGPRETEYKHGLLTWTTGANVGVVSEVKEYGHTSTGGQRDIELHLPTPAAIADADEFTIESGCDRLRTTCRDDFDNEDNHRGWPFMPGTDDTLETP